MISFSGYINFSAQKHIKKQVRKGMYFGMILLFILVGIPSIIAWIFSDIWVFFIMFLLSGVTMCFLVPITAKENYPVRITIDMQANEILGEFQKGVCSRSIDDVKKVVDMGTFYHILFYFPNQWANCICQKDLIVEGSIEEFEKLFEGLIVRKYETKD